MASLARHWTPVTGMLLLPLGLLIVLRADSSLDVRWFSAYGHLVVVSAIAACALVVAVLAAATAARTRKAPVVWLGIGCLVVGVAIDQHGAFAGRRRRSRTPQNN